MNDYTIFRVSLLNGQFVYPLTLIMMYPNETQRRTRWPNDSTYIYGFYGRQEGLIDYGTRLLLIGTITDTNRILTFNELGHGRVGLMWGGGSMTVLNFWWDVYTLVYPWTLGGVMTIADYGAIPAEFKVMGQTEVGSYNSWYNPRGPQPMWKKDLVNIRIGVKWNILQAIWWGATHGYLPPHYLTIYPATEAFIAGTVWYPDRIQRVIQGATDPIVP